MNLLLDTHTFIWMDNEPSKLSPTAAAALQDPANSVYLSVASLWEMVIKVQALKLVMRAPLAQIVAEQQANQIQIISVDLAHILALDALPTRVHKDPFDRIVAAQSIVDGMDLVTGDPIFAQYPVRVLW
jgi:PIN domain nuclease of toxin-antitoxin system